MDWLDDNWTKLLDSLGKVSPVHGWPEQWTGSTTIGQKLLDSLGKVPPVHG